MNKKNIELTQEIILLIRIKKIIYQSKPVKLNQNILYLLIIFKLALLFYNIQYIT